MEIFDVNTSAFAALNPVPVNKSEKKKKKKKLKRLSDVTSESKTPDLDSLLEKKKKEIHMNNSLSPLNIENKKRRKRSVSDDEEGLWQNFCKENPLKKPKKDGSKPGKSKEGLFSNCKITDVKGNIFLQNGTNSNQDSNKKKKKKNLHSTMFEDKDSPSVLPDISNIDFDSKRKKKNKASKLMEVKLIHSPTNPPTSQVSNVVVPKIKTAAMALPDTSNKDLEAKKKHKKANKFKEIEVIEISTNSPNVQTSNVESIKSKNLNDKILDSKSPPIVSPGVSNIDLELKKKNKKKKVNKLQEVLSLKNSIDTATDQATSEVPNAVLLKKIKKKKAADVNSATATKSLRNNEEHSKETTEKESKDLGMIWDSIETGKEFFSWLISPIGEKEFFNDVWEKEPLHIVREDPNFYNCVCTMDDLDSAFKKNEMYFTKNVDVTSYINGKRETDNPEGKARAPVVWELFNSGRSIRILNPQTFIPKVASLLAGLQEYFRCFVGSNIYLTPAGTQGFAPHYDDIEAFVLQLEGEKLWKVYKPRAPEEVLARVSSPNFDQEEIGDPVLEVTLKPGDMLYFPRGYIHQAKCLPGIHSLHITVSCYQKNSWVDLLEKLIPVALAKAAEEDVEFRQGLPLDYLSHLGIAHSDSTSESRANFMKRLKKLVKKLADYCPIDNAVDQLGKNFMHDALPPYLLPSESKFNSGPCDREQPRTVVLRKYIKEPLGIKLVRANVLRLVDEEEEYKLYYTTDNSMEYHGSEAMSLQIRDEDLSAIDLLIQNYPNFTQFKELCSGLEARDTKSVVVLIAALWEKGLILFDKPIYEVKS